VSEPPLHPDVEPLAFLLGTWRGEGAGHYPTVADFTYTEEITFGHVGKPMLTYRQQTRDAVTGEPRHAEVGYWRVTGPGVLEVVLAHPTGVTEVSEGTFDGGAIEVATTQLAATSTAKEVTELRRHIQVDGDTLRYDLEMAAVGQPLTHHLEATLHRIS